MLRECTALVNARLLGNLADDDRLLLVEDPAVGFNHGNSHAIPESADPAELGLRETPSRVE